MSPFQYVRDHYGVPAEHGRLVTVDGRPGIIASDLGHHIGVLFDADKPGHVLPCHPTWRVEYLGMGSVRKPSRNRARYLRYIEVSDCFDGFLDFCRHGAVRNRS